MCWLKRKSFVFYASYLEAANTLKAKERDTLYRAILEYGILGTEPQLKGAPLTCWILIKPQLDANNRKYENGKQGGRPSKNASFGFDDAETTGYFENEIIGFSERQPKMKPNEDVDVDENENVQQRPTAPPTAYAPMQGARGGMAALGSALDNGDRDAATDEARRKFFENIKRPAWAAADTAPPDAEKKE